MERPARQGRVQSRDDVQSCRGVVPLSSFRPPFPITQLRHRCESPKKEGKKKPTKIYYNKKQFGFMVVQYLEESAAISGLEEKKGERRRE
jgi:hypothetical protein